MAPPFGLLGPPELCRPNPSTNHPTTTPITTYEENHPPPLCKYQNHFSPPPLNPCLEFYFRATTYTDDDTSSSETSSDDRYSRYYKPQQQKPRELSYYEEKAWKLDPSSTLKLIFCLRMAGTPNEEAFYEALLWVHKNHPLTLSFNVIVFGSLGRFDELMEILYRVLQDSIEENKSEEIHRRDREYGFLRDKISDLFTQILKLDLKFLKSGPISFAAAKFCNLTESSYIKATLTCERVEKPKETRTDIYIAKAKTAVERYQNDQEYQRLYDRISELFAEFLRSDLKFLESGEVEKISLAAKFCPSIDSFYDRETLICESIARRIFQRHAYAEYKDVEEAHYAYRVRDRLRKHVLSPLRKALESCAARKVVNYSSFENRKALIALEKYRKALMPEGQNGGDEIKLQFECCMKTVDMLPPKKNALSIGYGLKLPHQILASLEKESGQSDETAELQWRRLVQQFSKQGKLSNCVAVCDIPESMRGTSKEMVCIAMGLLISELSEDPWKGKVLSFSDSPTLHKIEGDSLRSKCEFMRQNIECSEKVDFLKIYNRVLQVGITENLSQATMPKRIFVFTYKDFLTASKNNWEKDYKEALTNYRKKGYTTFPEMDGWTSYRKKGYETVPEIVFWNLKDSIAEPKAIPNPVNNQNEGIILTGFSNNLLRLFFRREWFYATYGSPIPAVQGIDLQSVLKFVPKAEDVIKPAVSIEEFKNLLVLD